MGSIQLQHVNKSFGAHAVIPDASLDIEDGEFVVFVGPSGCGKSTLLRLIAGLEDTTSGQILLDGSDMTDAAPAKRQLAMVFQSYALYPHMTVAQNIGFPLKMAGMDKAAIDAKVKEAARRPQPHQLSRPPAAQPLGRPAPARRHRPRHRARAQGLPVRRAAVEPRRGAARQHAARDLRAAPAAQDHHDLCHARPGRSHDHGRPDRRAQRRQRRAVRLADGALPHARPTASSPASSARPR